MPRKLGVPGCPKCHGEGMIAGEPIKGSRADGSIIEYPTVIRCVCISAPPADGAVDRKPDAQERAAGQKED